MTQKLNPYYLSYAQAHGRDPEAMSEADREDWPGGKNAGFILWMSRRWAEWHKNHGLPYSASAPPHPLSEKDHADFEGWLRGRSFALIERGVPPRSSRLEHSSACSIDKPTEGRYACVCDCGAEANAP